MKRSDLNKWLEALRSGEYNQAKNKMYDEKYDGYCCLGVLRKITNDKRSKKEKNDHSGQSGLTEKETRYFGMTPYGCAINNEHLSLSNINDYTGASFLHIADTIERNPLIYIKKIQEDI